MDFRFSPEDEVFRQEVRQFLCQETPKWGGFEEGTDGMWATYKEFMAKLSSKGWLSMTWPKEYGGQDAGTWRNVVLTEELAYHRAPMPENMALRVGTLLLRYGAEEQKRKYLPSIVRKEIEFCFGFSEPQTGSDLGSLRTTAVEDGNEYVINGQKMFTSLAHKSDYCWLAARTDPDAPKHRGISMFIVDMKTPGVTVRPLLNMARAHYFNELFFDSVRVPKECLVGGKNQGWRLLTEGLDVERTTVGAGVASAARARRYLDDLVAYAKATVVDGRPLAQKSEVRRKLAQAAIEIEVVQLLSYRLEWLSATGGCPDSGGASSAKVFGSEMHRRLAQTALEILGLRGQLLPGSPRAPLEGIAPWEYMMAWVKIFGGGTPEIQRNIVATRGLGLPRS